MQPTTLPGRAQRPTSLVPSNVRSTAAEHRDPTEAAPPGPIVVIRDALCGPASQCDPARLHHGHHWAVLRCKAFLRKNRGHKDFKCNLLYCFFFFFLYSCFNTFNCSYIQRQLVCVKIKILLSTFNVRFPKWTISIILCGIMYFITKIDPLAEETVFIICRNAYDSCK